MELEPSTIFFIWKFHNLEESAMSNSIIEKNTVYFNSLLTSNFFYLRCQTLLSNRVSYQLPVLILVRVWLKLKSKSSKNLNTHLSLTAKQVRAYFRLMTSGCLCQRFGLLILRFIMEYLNKWQRREIMSSSAKVCASVYNKVNILIIFRRWNHPCSSVSLDLKL